MAQGWIRTDHGRVAVEDSMGRTYFANRYSFAHSDGRAAELDVDADVPEPFASRALADFEANISAMIVMPEVAG